MRTISGFRELRDAEGDVLGTSPWHKVTQKAVEAYAKATGDKQWIYLDQAQARETPFEGTIVPGLYTLSLAPMFCDQVLRLEGFVMAVSHGFNKIRYPTALRVGAKVCARVKLASVEPVPGGAQLTLELTFLPESGEDPVCVAESVSRIYSGDSSAS